MDPVVAPDTKMQENVAVVGHVEESKGDDHVTAAAIGGDIDQFPKGYYWNVRFVGSMIGVILTTQCLYLGYVLPTNALSIINEDLGPSPNYVLISTVTTVTSGCLLALVGRLGDILGRRYFLIGGQVFALLAGIVGATAQSINAMIGASTLVGIAAGVQLTFTFVVCELVANRHRAYVDAILFCSTIPLAGIGPAMARLIITNTKAGWRWFYYLNIIISGVSLIFLGLFYFPPSFHQLHSRMTRWEQVKRIDWGGSVMFAAGVVLFMLGLCKSRSNTKRGIEIWLTRSNNQRGEAPLIRGRAVTSSGSSSSGPVY
jgi:MFS family permease